jgi:hypothetical protein
MTAVLDHFPSISLAELQAEAAFLTRSDRKYLVPVAALDQALAGLDPAVRVLEIDGRRSLRSAPGFMSTVGSASSR